MKRFSRRVKLFVVALMVFVIAFFSSEEEGVNLCAEAGKLGEDAWRECVDSYPGLTVDQITGKSPIPVPSQR